MFSPNEKVCSPKWEKCSPTFGLLTVWPLKWQINHTGDFHFQLFPVIFSDLSYDQGREEISSITQTLQSREFGEITMTIKCVCGQGHPLLHPTPLDAFGASILAPSTLATRRLGLPLLCSPKKSLNYTVTQEHWKRILDRSHTTSY